MVPMKWCLAILTLFLCLSCFASEKKSQSGASKHDRKAAAEEFKQAVEYKKSGALQDALMAASQAALLDPFNTEYAMARELLKQQIVRQYLDRGNRLAESHNNEAAAAEFRKALAINPHDSYVLQRLHDVSPPEDPYKKHTLELLASVDQINLQPKPGKKDLHLQGNARMVYAQIGKAFGIVMEFDQALSSRPTRFDLHDVDFYTATAIAAKMFKTFWAPISNDEVIVARDTLAKRRAYERMSVRTFYVNNAALAKDLNDLVNLMRVVFEAKYVSVHKAKNTITIRAPREKVEAIASLVDNLMDAKPEFLLEIRAMEFDADVARKYGLNLPNDFTIFNVPSEIRRVLGADAQPIIDQLNQTGTIDPSTIDPAKLQNLLNSPLVQPFILFGKGNGLTGVTIGPVSGTLSYNKSYTISLEDMTLHAIDGEKAIFRNGTKFPIVNSFFTTVASSNTGQAVLGNAPQFQYVDLGVTLKTTPHYLSGGSVKLDLDLEISGLGNVSFNGVPELTSRSFKGNITVRDGEPSVIAGLITDQEAHSTKGYPGIGLLPAASSVLNQNSSDRPHNEILIVITPHVVSRPFHNKGTDTLWDLGQ